MCDDIEATVEELRAKGVEFRGEPKDEGWGKVIVMVLPGGVEMVVYEPGDVIFGNSSILTGPIVGGRSIPLHL